MEREVEYSRRERFWLYVMGAFGFIGVNGVFLYGLLLEPRSFAAAIANPIAAAFLVEALVLVGVLAYLLSKWRVSRLAWGWFLFLSLVGSMAFALPIVLLWPRSKAGSRRREPPPA